jgi:N-acetylglucosamine kinase
MHVLGIDAGGTKTICLLADERGTVIAQARGGGANLQAAGELEVEKVLHQVMDDALADRDVHPAAICLGIAGVDRPEDAAVVRGIMRRIGFKIPTVVVNDALVALTAGAGNQPAIVVIAGTGSIAYGRNAVGQAARSGGWGYLLGDEGGGFWIGRAALSAVVRQFDGRGPATRLTDLILTEMHLADPRELVHQVYYRDVHRQSIAALAGVVQAAAAAGDVVASDILARAASELSAAAVSVIGRLGMQREAFPIVLAGGIFRGVPSLAHAVTPVLRDAAPRSDVRLLDVEPAVGAVRLALEAALGTLTIPAYA